MDGDRIAQYIPIVANEAATWISSYDGMLGLIGLIGWNGGVVMQ